ncbi:YeeE/YedE family protein [Terasakiella sp. A23]|uniref:YeeE/YedE family protein n=1 Tax=Terasakiella sp. FCG-A23 TaxID=3080561 RepID=UPI002953186C|nr:YeeE/YedE family protein [Terasakiella sp. A23]MDV7338034.1 YeeE/YedE family protein [Terasakiella sp. A23]
MNTTVPLPPSPNPTETVLSGPRVALVGAGLAFGIWFFAEDNLQQGQLFAIGLGLGAALFYGAFGFSAAYRKAIVHRDVSGVLAQIIMIGLATLLFAPVLSSGEASGAWAPVGVQVGIGAFIFGVGMQLGGACASGTLFSIGGGSLRMMITLFFFCMGAFIGSLHLGWWGQLPDWGTHSLGHLYGWESAVLIQTSIFVLLFFALRRWSKGHAQSGLWKSELGLKNLLIGPWPLIHCAIALALLNFATLMTAGHPWSITWAFTLWGAKTATVLGWDAASSGFWTAPFQAQALGNPVWQDKTSLMNIAVVIGAFAAAIISSGLKIKAHISLTTLLALIIGGLMMGYGARLAYGCNIGALFSGMASTSLHAWLWIFCAIPGTMVGIKLRPLFGLD